MKDLNFDILEFEIDLLKLLDFHNGEDVDVSTFLEKRIKKNPTLKDKMYFLFHMLQEKECIEIDNNNNSNLYINLSPEFDGTFVLPVIVRIKSFGRTHLFEITETPTSFYDGLRKINNNNSKGTTIVDNSQQLNIENNNGQANQAKTIKKPRFQKITNEPKKNKLLKWVGENIIVVIVASVISTLIAAYILKSLNMG